MTLPEKYKIVPPEGAELVVCAAPKDYNKLPFVLDAAWKYFQVSAMHVIAPEIDKLLELEKQGAILHRDADVLGWNRNEIKHRPDWVFQQFLKLFQNVTNTDWYLVIDADIVANKPIPIWNESRQPIFYVRAEPVNEQYYLYNQAMLDIYKATDYSLVTECTFYSRSLVNEMLVFCNLTRDGWWRKSVEVIHEGRYPAESEVYGAFVLQEYPDLYEIRPIRHSLGGRYNNHVWTEAEIIDELERKKRDDSQADLFSLHSWEGLG